MQTALTLRKSSISPIVTISAVVLAVSVGGASGYWAKGQLSFTATSAAQRTVAAQGLSVASPLGLPDAMAQHEDSRLFIAPAESEYITQREDSHLVIGEAVSVTDAVDRAVARANASEPDAVDRALAHATKP